MFEIDDGAIEGDDNDGNDGDDGLMGASSNIAASVMAVGIGVLVGLDDGEIDAFVGLNSDFECAGVLNGRESILVE